MKKSKEKHFFDQFNLLNSQENVADIKWSSSEESDYENASFIGKLYNITNKMSTRKRKRTNRALKNIPSLDITLIDTIKAPKFSVISETSPEANKKCKKSVWPSPILPLSKSNNLSTASHGSVSPILQTKVKSSSVASKSPILSPRLNFIVVSPKLRRKLYNPESDMFLEPNTHIKEQNCINNSKNDNLLLDKSNKMYIKEEVLEISNTINESQSTEKKKEIYDINKNRNQQKIKIEDLDDSFNSNPASLVLASKVKSFFESHLSSDTISQTQQSISDVTTPQSSKTSDELDIVMGFSQNISNECLTQLIKQESIQSNENSEIGIEKKVKYKKNGLAYRLNMLVKKQVASVSLWHHERFLAENSNFKIPKGEHVTFRIQKVQFEYGCYLINAIDRFDKEFLIYINRAYVYNDNIRADMILKLYEPYKTLDFHNNCKLIINVCKFECIEINL